MGTFLDTPDRFTYHSRHEDVSSCTFPRWPERTANSRRESVIACVKCLLAGGEALACHVYQAGGMAMGVGET